jgi:hypothetical protein
LLVVMTVMMLLASMALFAMFGAQERARVARTRATVNKLNAVIMPLYEAFQIRRVPIVTAGMGAREGAYTRLQALRELMMVEMPDRFTDIENAPQILPRRTSLAMELQRRLNQIESSSGKTRTTQHQGAECLYLIVTMSTSDGAGREHFSEEEVGDKDDDGLPEFLDGWGRPISFLRWPAGFNSPLQPFRKDTPRDVKDGEQWEQGRVYHDFENSRDPFDTRRVEEEERNYAIFPLIYSPGGDGVADISSSPKDSSGNPIDPYPVIDGRINPYRSDFKDGPLGRQRDKDDDGPNWHDNIHNHSNKAE